MSILNVCVCVGPNNPNDSHPPALRGPKSRPTTTKHSRASEASWWPTEDHEHLQSQRAQKAFSKRPPLANSEPSFMISSAPSFYQGKKKSHNSFGWKPKRAEPRLHDPAAWLQPCSALRSLPAAAQLLCLLSSPFKDEESSCSGPSELPGSDLFLL